MSNFIGAVILVTEFFVAGYLLLGYIEFLFKDISKLKIVLMKTRDYNGCEKSGDDVYDYNEDCICLECSNQFVCSEISTWADEAKWMVKNEMIKNKK